MSETARMLADTAERFLERNAPEPGQGTSADFFSAVQETGLPLALAPEDVGGIEGAWSDAAIIARIWGRNAAPLPIVEMMLAGKLAGIVGEEALQASVAQPGKLRLTADQQLEGDPIEAAWFDEATAVIAVAESGSGGRQVVLIAIENPAAGVDLAGQPRLRISPEDVPASAIRVAGTLEHSIEDKGALLTAAAMLGAMDRVLEIVIEHANTRQQFGRPLGKFQAIQHMISDAASEITATRAALDGALALADEGLIRAFDAQVAKVQAAHAATKVAATAHQVLGAIGFTDEHMLHYFTKRLWSWRDDWGRQGVFEEKIGRAAVAAGRDGLWGLIIGDEIEAARV